MVNYLEGKKYVKWPNKMMADLSKKDNFKSYAFHRKVGHTTEEYRILKNEIHKLIQNGYLKEFMCHLKQR